MNKVLFGIIGILLALLYSTVPTSADSSAYEIQAVYVNGIEVRGSTPQVTLGSTAQIQVYLEGTGEPTDVRVGAWIGGYEYGTVEVSSGVFTVEDGISYRKYLSLEIPNDLDVSSPEYTLHVEVFDSKNREERTYTLYLEQERHAVQIEDILLSSSSVAPGDYLGVKVRLDNQGEKDEEDLKLTVSIPDLGISQRVYLDALASGEQANAPSAYLVLPRDASGEHEVLVEVSYDNGASEVVGRSFLDVSGRAVYDTNTYVSISMIHDLQIGEASTYKVQVSNLAERGKTFSLYVEGMDATVHPAQIVVPAGSTGEFSFTLDPQKVGSGSVFVEVSSDEGLVLQKLYTVDVSEPSTLFAISMSVLLAVFVVLGIFFSLRFWSR